MFMNLAIIGTAGRREDGPKMNRQLFDRMLGYAAAMVDSCDCNAMISGGAAWADHLAVKLFLMGRAKKLVLHLPARFETTSAMYIPWTTDFKDSGRIANHYHQQMSQKYGDSLLEISQAVSHADCEHTVSRNFHDRNKLVAEQADLILAFTWGEGQVPKDGGTRHTWDIAKCAKRHVPLGMLV